MSGTKQVTTQVKFWRAYGTPLFLFHALSTTVLLLTRPSGVLLPGFVFYGLYAAAPCSVGLASVFLARNHSFIVRASALLIGLYLYSLLWNIQIRFAMWFANRIESEELVGKLNNFFVFSNKAYIASLLVSIGFLLLFVVFTRYGRGTTQTS
jgi:hypothetical protein